MRRASDLIGPMMLILAGVLLLLNTTGVIPWTIWSQIWRFWPVFLIIWGVAIFFGSGARAFGMLFGLMMLLLAITVFTNILPLAFDHSWGRQGLTRSREFAVSYEDFQPARVNIRASIGTGAVRLETAPRGGTGHVLDVNTWYQSPEDEPELTTSMSGNQLSIWYGTKVLRSVTPFRIFGLNQEHNLFLGRPDLPTALNISLGAGKLDAVLDQAAITSIDLTVGGGQATMRFPNPAPITQDSWTAGSELRFDLAAGKAQFYQLGNLGLSKVRGKVGAGSGHLDFANARQAGSVEAVFEVGAGDVTIVIPRDAGIRATANIGVGSFWIDDRKYAKRDFGTAGHYVSPNYDTAVVKFNIRADIGAGRVKVERSR